MAEPSWTDIWLNASAWDYGLVPVILLAILALMAAVRFASKHFELSPELQRKIIHVAVGLSSLLFPWIFSGPLPVFILIACAILIMLWLRKGKGADQFGGVLHAVSRPSYGEIYLALSVALLFYRSIGDPVLYVLPLLVITLSDTASALVGTAYGRRRFPVEGGEKSLEGVVAFFMVTWIAALVVLLLLTDTARLNVVLISFLIAAFCALVEADSWHGLDNLFVPVGAHLLLARYMAADPILVVWVAVAFIAAVLVALRYAEALGMTRHAARSYTIMLFLVLSVTTPSNAVLPLLVIGAHLAARKLAPCRSKRADLDMLAAMTAVAMLWLLLGEGVGRTTINLFNITFAGVMAVLLTFAFKRQRIWAAPVVAGVAILTCVAVIQLNPAQSRWYHATWPPVAMGVLTATGLAVWRPAWFDSYRSLKAFGAAMIVPFVLFLSDGAMR